MTDVFRPTEDSPDNLFILEWYLGAGHMEEFGCGEADEEADQGLQPLILAGN